MYAKVFRALWDGSLCGQSDVQLVFIYLLAHADADGGVCQPRVAIAAKTGLAVLDVEAAISILEAEDASSGSVEEGGRRLLRHNPVRDEWNIVNYLKYRGMRDDVERRKQNREAKQRQRVSDKVSQGQPASSQGEGEVEVEGEVDTPTHLAENPAVVVVKELLKPKQEWEEGFGDFWKLYPRRIKKPTALRAWQALRPGTIPEQGGALEEICSGLERWLAYWQEHETPEDKIPYPATFLNGRQHEDYPS